MALSVVWYYAKVTGRVLVIDWRDTLYLTGTDRNLFTELFEVPDEIGGVTILCEDLDSLDLPGPRITTKRVNRKKLNWRIAWDVDFSHPTVTIKAGINHHSVERFFYEDAFGGFIKALRPRESIASQTDQFIAEHFQGRKVIGVHIRHGNGETGHFQDHKRQIEDLDRLLAEVKAKSAPHLGEDPLFFLATDSQIAIDRFKRDFPDAVVRDQWRPAPDTGNALHLGSDCPDGEVANAANAWIDMDLLAQCDVAIFSRLSSMHSVARAKAKGAGKPSLEYCFDVDDQYRIGKAVGQWPRSYRARQVRGWLYRTMRMI